MGRCAQRWSVKAFPIGSLDTLIAAHALSLPSTLVTCNEREFRRIEGLTVENWLLTDCGRRWHIGPERCNPADELLIQTARR